MKKLMFSAVRDWRKVGAALLVGALSCTQAMAKEDYPTRPVKIVVGFAPGGTNDIIARTIAQKLQTRLGQPFIVENRPGAASAIAGGLVARAEADGYTLLVSSSGGLTVNPVLMKDLSYDAVKDFEPIALLGTFPLVAVTNKDRELNSIADLKAYSESNGNGLNHGVASTSFQLVAELLAQEANLDLTHIMYRGSGPAIEAVMKDEVDVAFLDSGAVVNHIKSGHLKPLAVTTAERSKTLPMVPTVAESGIEGYDAPIWTGFVAPMGTPEAVMSTLRAAMNEILQDEEMVHRLDQLGMEPGNTDAAALSKRIVDDIDRWAQIVKVANIPLR
ncbi:Bug family tripartite tricarboxylate transporter substrate binding protein [Alcaligenes endophyticus]|uniref:Tripartite tricarboxylate transporter substrate binding protein n=1 Tax=Alcaligenes endophyticus TaxID=1929088 RepID=A0ABT8EM65_9BURK|nr:tripartite tricarboxylate transporter substrate binding protein [Alcaligenes endophyticus]MCX5591024.1 tripartite tricarboxylate transporter substrate binding protein [Alcaligenes endophyticus]MDN4122399.1 tripartite tricarboxylate transporter substrate binding protein [Alcaligenes endophyticus]